MSSLEIENGHLLSVAIGSCLGERKNLMRAYLPVARAEDAIALVRAANDANALSNDSGSLSLSAKPEDSAPFAILVSETVFDNAEGVTQVDAGMAASYREGDRLAVCVGRVPDLATITGTFQVVMGPSWPKVESSSLMLSDVAPVALSIAIAASGRQAQPGDSLDTGAARLHHILVVLRDAYELLGATTKPWNALWYEHINAGLSLLSDAVARADASADLAEVVEDSLYAAFSLPSPLAGMNLPTASRLVKALSEHWFDADSIATSVALLARNPHWLGTLHNPSEHEPHPMARIDWTGFGRTLAESGCTLAAFGTHELTASARLEAFSKLSVPEFLNPVAEGQNEPIEILGTGGIPLARAEIAGPLAVLTCEGLKDVGDTRALTSEVVSVRIPLVGIPSASDVAGSRMQLLVTPRAASFEGSLALVDGALFMQGRFNHKVGNVDFEFRPVKCHVSIDLDAADPLVGVVQSAATASYLLLPPSGAAVVLLTKKNGAPSGAPVVLSWERFDSGGVALESSSIVHRLRSEDPLRIVTWTSTSTPTLDGALLGEWPDRPSIAYGDANAASEHVISAGQYSVELLPAEDSNRPLSPLVAASLGVQASEDYLPESLVSSLRGELEAELVRLLMEGTWTASLGHVFLPSDVRAGLGGLVSSGNGAFVTTPELQQVWGSLGALGVPTQLTESDEVGEFRAAFSALGIEESLRRGVGEGGSLMLWPSRIAWGHLWEDRMRLERYLTAYARMVTKARSIGNPVGVLWAAYPFSCSAWTTTQLPASCDSVYLSPLHPIRLAWLASVESTLRAASEPLALAGAIEGWNLPFLGPNESSNGRMLAIPTDNGEGEIFAGWSVLIRASIESPKVPSPPEYVGARRAPGSSASGLNGGGTLAAIRDYRRLHPFATTITVDLAASSPSPRLEEIDRAVLREVGDWSKSDETLIGGARILDSLNRLGEAPRDELSEATTHGGESPLVWSRYRPKQGEQPASNIRILQDAGVAMKVVDASAGDFGLISDTPLRRFEAVSNEVTESATSSTDPVIAAERGWHPMTAALRALEVPDDRANGPGILTQLVGGVLASNRAEWTISGDSMVTPAALARQIHEHSSDQALWEWRPPFLATGFGKAEAGSLLQRRPFLSVVRVPESLKTQVQKKLSASWGVPATVDQATNVLRSLGARGVGLSSLIAIGGAHATGALGFYTTLELLDRAEPEDAHQFVLPIDACDKFLLALVGRDPRLVGRRRADLLVIRLDDRRLTLVAVEVKYYGLDTPKSAFPGLGTTSYDEPIEQLSNTQSLLAGLAERWDTRELTSHANNVLWLNGLTALIEAGARLTPARDRVRSDLARRLQRLMDGEMQVICGSPLLAYFQHGPAEGGHIGHEAHFAAPSGSSSGVSHSTFLADPAAVAAGLTGSNPELLNAWASVLDASFSNPIPSSITLVNGHVVSSASRSGGEMGDSTDDPGNEPPNDHKLDVVENFVHMQGSVQAQANEAESSVEDDSAADEQPEALGDGVKFSVGRLLNAVGPAEAYFWPGNTALTQLNIGIAGDLGTGKTQLIKALLANLRHTTRTAQDNPLSVLVLDYKGDYEDAAFLSATGGRVLRPHKIPFNFFEMAPGYTSLAAVRRAGSFIDVLTQIYSGIGPVQQNLLRNVIVSAYATGVPPTVDEVLVAYRANGGAPDSVVGVLETFVLSEIFATRGDRLETFDELMRDSVVVVNLLDLGSDQKAKNAIVALFLNQYYEFMSRQTKWPYVGEDPQVRRLNSFLLVDEATNIMQYKFDALEQLLLQGREFGVGVILSSQYLSHFKDGGVDYAQALRTWFIHKVPNVSVQQLQRLGLPHAGQNEVARITGLATHEAYYSSQDFPGRFISGTPFYRLEGAELRK